ncbi:MAG TPA: TetR/AcrR family transcriptional regulator [Solimonas sp.]|nr:TetR/AcrR family transcriptional regulator [Solimonas sp.]
MNDLSTPGIRPPLQQRGQARTEAVLAAARDLLAQEGLSGFSIPALAERLGFSRMSIYHFFPSQGAIIGELARRALDELERRVVSHALEHPEVRWKGQIAGLLGAVVEYFDEDPVAQLLILGGGLTAEGYTEQSRTVLRLGNLTNRLFESGGLSLPRKPIDTPVLLIDLGITCMRMSVQLHGRVTPDYQREVVETMARYIEPYLKSARGE